MQRSGGSLDERGVTRREAEVLAALGERLTNAEIAARLYLSERTVESHVSSLLRKLGAGNRLELAALAKDAAVPGRRLLPAPLELLADPTTYVGRRAERDRLRDLWRRASEGHVLVAVIAGEAGIGKSRIVAELAAEVHAAGVAVLLGSCYEDVQLPFEPFVRAIADDVAALTDDELRRRVGVVMEPLARLVPEVAQRLGTAPPEAPDPLAGRADVLAALQRYLRTAAGSGPLLLVVEDAHWATATTRDALRHIARIGGHVPLLVAVTTRDAPPDLDGGLTALLASLARLPNVEHVELAGLPEDDVRTMLGALGDDADPGSVVAETGGNPLLVQEIAGSRGRASTSLPQLLAERDRRLDAGDGPVVEAAAVVGAEFDVDLLAVAVGRPAGEVLESIERAAGAGIVAPVRGRPGRFAFVHGLFRSARYEAIPIGRRLRLHRQVTAAMLPRAGDDRVVPELARHAAIAAPLGDARRALELTLRAATIAERALALEESAGHLRRALAVVDLLVPAETATRLAVLVRLGEALQGAGSPEARQVLLDAAALARAEGDAGALASIACAVVKYDGPRAPSNRDPELVAVIEDALDALGPAPTAARALVLAAASEDLCLTDPAAARALAEEARAVARSLDDPVTLGHVLLSYRNAARTPDNADARHPTADELVAIGRRTGRSAFTFLGLWTRAWTLREEGDLAGVDEAIDSVMALRGDRVLPPTYEAAVALFQSARASLRGHLGDAERLAEGVWDVAERGFEPQHWYGPAILVIRHDQGRLPELIPVIEAAAGEAGVGDVYRSALSVAYANAGRHADAAAILRRFADDGFAGVPRNFTWIAGMAALAETAEAVGDAEAAAAIGASLEPYTGWLADLPQAVVGSVDLALAQTALATGDAARAARWAAAAVEASRRRGTPVFLGRELVRLAAARRRLGASHEAVAPLLAEAIDIAERTGAGLIRLEAQRAGLLDDSLAVRPA